MIEDGNIVATRLPQAPVDVIGEAAACGSCYPTNAWIACVLTLEKANVIGARIDRDDQLPVIVCLSRNATDALLQQRACCARGWDNHTHERTIAQGGATG